MQGWNEAGGERARSTSTRFELPGGQMSLLTLAMLGRWMMPCGAVFPRTCDVEKKALLDPAMMTPNPLINISLFRS